MAAGIASTLAGLWRLHLGQFIKNRITVELDLIEERRRNEHLKLLTKDLVEQIEYYRKSANGSGSK